MRSFVRSPRALGVAFLAAGLLALAGCGGGKASRASISGKVTVNGKGPLTGGTITFVSISNESEVGGGNIKSDGTYEAVDVPVGECKVIVSNAHLNLSKSGMGGGMPGMGGGMPGGMTGAGPGTGKGMPGMGGPPAGGGGAKTAEKMGSAPKGAEVDGKMGEGKDTGTPKYMKIDPAFEAAGTTTLRHTVTKGENTNVNFDVK